MVDPWINHYRMVVSTFESLNVFCLQVVWCLYEACVSAALLLRLVAVAISISISES